MDLTDYREKLDQIDDQILELLHQRAEVVKQVGRFKEESGAETIYVPHREKEILRRLKVLNEGRFPEAALESIYGEIISACRALEKTLQIAYLGPPGSFGHAASLRHFGSSAEFLPFSPQTDIFGVVESGQADYGVVAIENSTGGTVHDVLEMFQETPLQICAEVFLPIDHKLLSKSPLSEITKIYSHPQPFVQCRRWLHQNISAVKQVQVASSSEAANLARNEPGAAAIASQLASEIYDLPIVSDSIADNPNNTTRFLIIGKHSAEQSGSDRTSVLFAIKDKPGSLWEVLGVLKDREINMSKLESRPSRETAKVWEYVFFVDIDGHRDDENVRAALDKFEAVCVSVKILGSYPRGS